MARRAEHGGSRFRRLKLKLGARDGLDVEPRARRAGVTEPAAPGGRERIVDARRGARALPQLAARRVLRAAAAAGDRGGAELKRRSPSRSTSTRTATRSTTSPRAPRSHTAINIKLAKSGGIREAIAMATRRGRSASA
jgi:hypothetical protein